MANVSADQLAALFACTTRTITTLVKNKVLEKTGKTFDVSASVTAYVKHLREAAAGRAPTGDLDPSQERARKDKELADKTAMENAVTRGELVSVNDVGIAVEAEYSVVRDRLLTIPGKLAAKLVGLDRTAIDLALFNEISEALGELHAPAVEGNGARR